METLKNNVLVNHIINLFKHKDDITIPKDIRDLINVYKYFKDPINEKDRDFQVIANYITNGPKKDEFASHLLSFYEKYQIRRINSANFYNGRSTVMVHGSGGHVLKNENELMKKFDPIKMVMTEPGNEICIVKGDTGLFTYHFDGYVLPGHFMAYDLNVISFMAGYAKYTEQEDMNDIIENNNKQIESELNYIEVKLSKDIILKFKNNKELKDCFTILNPLIVYDNVNDRPSYPRISVYFKKSPMSCDIGYKTFGFYKDIIGEIIPKDKDINVVYNNEKYRYYNDKVVKVED